MHQKCSRSDGQAFPLLCGERQGGFVTSDHHLEQDAAPMSRAEKAFFKFQRAPTARRKTVREWRDFEQQMIVN
jgi:hypothetical protein